MYKQDYVRMHCTQIAAWGILRYPALFLWGILGYPGVSGVSCASVAFSQAHVNYTNQCENVYLAEAVCLNHNSRGCHKLPPESLLGAKNLCRTESFIILEGLKDGRGLWPDICRLNGSIRDLTLFGFRILQATWFSSSLCSMWMRCGGSISFHQPSLSVSFSHVPPLSLSVTFFRPVLPWL